MDKKDTLNILEIVLLQCDGCSEGDLLIKYKFNAQDIFRAREVIKLIEKK